MTKWQRLQGVGWSAFLAGCFLSALACGGLGSPGSPGQPIPATGLTAFGGKLTRAEFLKKLDELDTFKERAKEASFPKIIDKQRFLAAFGDPQGDTAFDQRRLWTYTCRDSILVLTVQPAGEGSIWIMDLSYQGF